MLIRHDLGLVFLHVPKCAGKQLRSLLVDTAPPGSLRELWNYSYSNILHRYVDLAHLPLRDLRAFPEYDYLDHYKVLACIRNPYARLLSAVNEFYRQRSPEDERTVNENRLSEAMKDAYYDPLLTMHAATDPRYVHSLPIHHFTHYGEQPKADFLLRCEYLKTEFLELAERLQWPEPMRERARQVLRDDPDSFSPSSLSSKELELANALYRVDLNTFSYPTITSAVNRYTEHRSDPAALPSLYGAPSLAWHWGPTAANHFPRALKPNRP